MTKYTVEELQRFIETCKRRLTILEEQVVRYGPLAPPNVVMDWEDEKKRLEEYEQLLEEKRYEEAESRLCELSERLSAAEESIKLEFVNRAYEADRLCNPSMIHRVIILDAPAGFGKTELLKEVKRRLTEGSDKEQWICEIVDFKDAGRSEKALVQELARKVSFPQIEQLRELSAMKIVRRLLGHLGSRPERNIMLIFDSADVNLKVAQWLDETFAPKADEILSPKYWWIVIAGRYIRDTLDPDRPYMTLTPFNRPVIEQMVETIRHTFLPHTNVPRDKFDYIVNLVDELSGGHPRCIIDIALDLARTHYFIGVEEPLPEKERKRLFEDHTQPAIDDILKQVPDTLREVIERLSIFRGFNFYTLEELIKKGHIKGYAPDHSPQLFESLMSTRFYNPSSIRYPLYSDRITRRLLETRLRLLESEFYQELNEVAANVYESWITATFEAQPLLTYFIEGLYHQARCVEQDCDRNKRQKSLEYWVYNQLKVIEVHREKEADFAEVVSRIKRTLLREEEYWDVRDLLDRILERQGRETLIKVLDDTIKASECLQGTDTLL